MHHRKAIASLLVNALSEFLSFWLASIKTIKNVIICPSSNALCWSQPLRLHEVMTEKAESSKVLVNVLRTTPYTAYVATLSAGLAFPDSGALTLFVALIVNEIVNHALKKLVKIQLGVTPLTMRPEGAKDCGIYPQHNPSLSKSSGMPSGHSQTACFLATILLQRGSPGPAGTAYIVLYTLLVLLSRYTCPKPEQLILALNLSVPQDKVRGTLHCSVGGWPYSRVPHSAASGCRSSYRVHSGVHCCPIH